MGRVPRYVVVEQKKEELVYCVIFVYARRSLFCSEKRERKRIAGSGCMTECRGRYLSKTGAAPRFREASMASASDPLTGSFTSSLRCFRSCFRSLAQRLHLRQRLAERSGRKPALRLVGLAGTSSRIIEEGLSNTHTTPQNGACKTVKPQYPPFTGAARG